MGMPAIGRTSLAIPALVAVLLAASPLASRASVPAERPGAASMRIARDPETGGWRLAPLSAAETLRAEADLALNQSAEGLVTESLPDGGFTMDLMGRFQSYSVARLGASGALETNCDENPLGLLRWLSEAPAPVDTYGRPTR